MNILITGSKGFIGKNLVHFIKENSSHNIIEFGKNEGLNQLKSKLLDSNFIIHLAGVNRPKENKDFKKVNIDLTKKICEFLQDNSLKTPIVFSSSIQATLNNEYGISKKKAENFLINLNKNNNNPVFIYRLPGVFGKWSKPNYNSVIATFCYNIINEKKIKINYPDKEISLIYIDDLVKEFSNLLNCKKKGLFYFDVKTEYKISIKSIAENIKNFHNERKKLFIDKVGSGFIRKLYSTYVSFLNEENFYYHLIQNKDQRGVFAEVIKTKNSGQISYFTAKPGISRGGHYHNTKTEKFIVIHGKARFDFKNLITGKTIEIFADCQNPIIVDTIPGWIHKITNIGLEELKVILWSNEVFDKNTPDTYQKEV